MCAPGHPTETEPDLPLSFWVSPMEVQVSSGLLQGQRLWVQQTWVWHKPSWRRSPLTSPLSHQNFHRTGETDSWRAQTKPCVHQDPGERSSDPKTDWPSLSHECTGVSGRGVGQWWPAAGLGAPSAAVPTLDLWKEVDIIFITSTTAWPPVKQQGANTAPPPPTTENWIKDLLSIALPIRTRPSFLPSQSLPSGSFHKPLILFHQRADRPKTTITEN